MTTRDPRETPMAGDVLEASLIKTVTSVHDDGNGPPSRQEARVSDIRDLVKKLRAYAMAWRVRSDDRGLACSDLREAADRLETIQKAWRAFSEFGTHDAGQEYEALRRAIEGTEP